MEPDLYLRKHHIMTYLEDATAMLLEKRRKDRRMSPLVVLLDYFARLRNGTHVYGRDFDFVSITPYNRGAFVGTFWRCFYRLGRRNDTRMCDWEYHQMIQLLCSDFPTKYSDQVYRIFGCRKCGSVAPVKELRLNLAEFLYMFQVVFYYEKFLAECEQLFNGTLPQSGSSHSGSKSMSNMAMLEGSNKDRDSNRDESKALHSSSVVKSSSNCPVVSSEIIVPLIEELCHRINTQQPWIVAPSLGTISEALRDDLSATSFTDFVYLLYTTAGVNKDIQQLPPRDEFHLTTPSSSTTVCTNGSEE